MKKTNLHSRSQGAKPPRSRMTTIKFPSKAAIAPKKRGQLAPKKHKRNAPTAQKQLSALAKSIRTNHRYCSRRLVESIKHALQAGRDLIEAKELCAHGEWLPWLEKNCEVGDREAQRYMRFARHFPEGANPTDVSDLPSMSRGLLAIAAAKNDDTSESNDQNEGDDSDQASDADDEESGDRDGEDDAGDEESGEDDSYDDDNDDDESDADDIDDEENGDSTDGEDDDDDQDEPEDLDTMIDRFVASVENAAAELMPRLDELTPIRSKHTRRALKDCRVIIKALLGASESKLMPNPR